MFLLFALIAPLLADVCEDKAEGCSELIQHCNQPALKNFLQKYCSKSCRFCGPVKVAKIYPLVPALRPASECKDTLELCTKYQAKVVCRGGFYKYCPKTCGRCTVRKPAPKTQYIPKTQTLPEAQDLPNSKSPAIPETQPLSKFARAILSAHNERRLAHLADKLTWSDTAAQYAHAWCTRLEITGRFEHSELKGRYGENLYSLFDFYQRVSTDEELANRAVKAWYDEIFLYDFTTAQYSAGTGHFTQIVWRGTTSVGCSAVRRGGRDLVCCNYSKPGNVLGQFADNVLPPFESGWML